MCCARGGVRRHDVSSSGVVWSQSALGRVKRSVLGRGVAALPLRRRVGFVQCKRWNEFGGAVDSRAPLSERFGKFRGATLWVVGQTFSPVNLALQSVSFLFSCATLEFPTPARRSYRTLALGDAVAAGETWQSGRGGGPRPDYVDQREPTGASGRQREPV